MSNSETASAAARYAEAQKLVWSTLAQLRNARHAYGEARNALQRLSGELVQALAVVCLLDAVRRRRIESLETQREAAPMARRGKPRKSAKTTKSTEDAPP